MAIKTKLSLRRRASRTAICKLQEAFDHRNRHLVLNWKAKNNDGKRMPARMSRGVVTIVVNRIAQYWPLSLKMLLWMPPPVQSPSGRSDSGFIWFPFVFISFFLFADELYLTAYDLWSIVFRSSRHVLQWKHCFANRSTLENWQILH